MYRIAISLTTCFCMMSSHAYAHRQRWIVKLPYVASALAFARVCAAIAEFPEMEVLGTRRTIVFQCLNNSTPFHDGWGTLSDIKHPLKGDLCGRPRVPDEQEFIDFGPFNMVESICPRISLSSARRTGYRSGLSSGLDTQCRVFNTLEGLDPRFLCVKGDGAASIPASSETSRNGILTGGANPSGLIVDVRNALAQRVINMMNEVAGSSHPWKVVARGPGEADTFHKSLVAGSIQACSVLNFSEKQITLYQMALVPRALKAQVNLQGVGDRTLGEIRRISGSKIPHARSLLQQASDAEDDERRKRRPQGHREVVGMSHVPAPSSASYQTSPRPAVSAACGTMWQHVICFLFSLTTAAFKQ
ncbi:hypothetical protein CKAH01_05553 [Colletotrichum kahawae]|uniref:Uncharacterized protein n=1 Tax=Colletotrichum kahawae TaxID=34407 RepID=A0AAD9YES4_COLKA|nr:hypothetical protein CKAH01_05553 [Colletotrichum kahawae]